MRCPACETTPSPYSTTPLCPACAAVAGLHPPLPATTRPDATWLWTSTTARTALSSGDLGTILRAYRAATRTSQRSLAEHLGYDTTYISMIETGRRDISDVTTLIRIAHRIGIPAHVLRVTEPDDADFTAMLQFAEATLRLAILARQSGHGTAAVNELWPVAARLEARVAAGRTEPDVLHLLARVRLELGVSLGYILPEQRLAHAARWTWRALTIAEHLDDPHLHAATLRAHGNELRKAGHLGGAVARLHHALVIADDAAEQGAAAMQLARAIGEQGHDETFDAAFRHAEALAAGTEAAALTSPIALHEVQIRGLGRTGRAGQAQRAVDNGAALTANASPQWQIILGVTIAEIHQAVGDINAADIALGHAITAAEHYRLPHQLQRAQRCAAEQIPPRADECTAALARLTPASPASQSPSLSSQ
jgi:transcriptional regulator with XRE-family HTH domain